MFIDPMLLATAPAPFSDPRFIFEPKIDGHRLIFSQQDGTVRLYTRHNNDCTRQYPEIASALFPHDIVLDGEIACVDPATGVSDFEAVMTRFQAKKADKIVRLSATLPTYYAIFDILMYKGEDMRRRPLRERKELLASLKMPSSSFGIVPHVEGAGEALFAQIEARGMEGVVGKRADSAYETGRRSDSWRKVINWTYADVYITGYKKAEFGWLVGVADRGGKVRPAGIIELGVGPKERKAFYGVSRALITGEDRNYVYVEPRIRAKVKMRNWTKSRLLRSPVFEEFLL
ncbi:SPBc2 prophage-derived DNA ligase-like protein LigB [Paenibacillus faecis]|uniref:ATP-dependent DNA ligase n=1 Tax=Paenibacillus faecis TaxID=862114 RepID=UPI001B0F3E47|nr:ATP-dependent DNA ligase [Paenibacillus faecis]GIO84510.1 SPBc2 prophage-derived DNA ligase-like protein LigB [Paenibacillus faecis]